ncbi:MAG TPA: IspD/TarI family cytidylyltransferase [Spirochaetota bacterium]|nr:IspD/TarI family cytidylyltransferase [Spirochaetota bacterium]HOM38162.1 IspD/TarI family cytidylyltransferase [Spirochaetota bacterium]HPQ48620.1 IspD/TarI family cytidylyltransferase [Spirochaetota bacterium]
MNFCIILAAGAGTRFGSLKQFEKINNREIFLYSIDKFLKSGKIDYTTLVINKEKIEYTKNILKKENINNIKIVEGGETRFLSLINGLKYLQNIIPLNPNDNLIIHDAARPNFSIPTIDKIIDKLNTFEVVTLGYKITDALKKISKEKEIIFLQEDVDRENIWAVTTPQGFKIKLFIDLLKNKDTKIIPNIYDETSLFMKNNKSILIEDTRYNIKITYKEDIDVLKKIMIK